VGELGLGHAAANDVIEALLAASRNRVLPPTVQRDAGFSLGRAGWQPDDLDAFITIPAGPFLYGLNNEKKVIEQPYQIAKYPVTNLQYRCFMDAHGYDRQEFWSEDGWRWRTGTYDTKATKQWEKDTVARRLQEKRGEPFYWNDLKWNNPLAPVVGVCWFEAEAYCRWLSKESGQPIHLPTEEQWERAARHTDGRVYPWGKDFDRNRLNSAELWGSKSYLDWSQWWSSDSYKAASTTIVGQFAAGNSVAGVSDLSGNVWGWTAAWYDEQRIHRAVRGGAWTNDRGDTRSASRGRGIPDNYSDEICFRVVSPGA
jgi:formylglycine-generating enzyme required for sulfatase activity